MPVASRITPESAGESMQLPQRTAILADIALCVGFFTRVPVPAGSGSLAGALWAAPVAGVLIGLASGVVLIVVTWLGLPAAAAALIAIASAMLLTGALHEDGAADVADGFGGGDTRSDKLDVMRDSRIGSYGTLALILSVLARWAALSAILAAAGPGTALLALVSAHGASRAMLPAFLSRVPPARATGLSAGIGTMATETALVALAIGIVALVVSGIGFAIVASLVLLLLFLAMEHLSLRQIGGQTGDVLGALQQAAEIAVLLCLSAFVT